jgi:hypothetical protein
MDTTITFTVVVAATEKEDTALGEDTTTRYRGRHGAGHGRGANR